MVGRIDTHLEMNPWAEKIAHAFANNPYLVASNPGLGEYVQP